MKITLRTALVIGVISLSISTAIFADVPITNVMKSASGRSSANHRGVQQESAITNEAEYADFVRKSETTNKSSYTKSAPIQTPKYSTTSASFSSTSSSRKASVK